MRCRVAAVCCGLVLSFSGALLADEKEAIESIQAKDIRRHAEVLADDSYEGREAGSRGGRAAAGYIRQLLAEDGLKPAGDNGSWFQTFDGAYRNLLARLPGSDKAFAGEVIIIGAHYDHVGYGTPTNSYGPWGNIHNGADDNASGTSALLEAVEAFKVLGVPPRRTILFVFWDGEEKGLLGSKHWTSSGEFSKEKIKLYINLDMVGRLRDDRLIVYGTRSSYGLRRWVSEANEGTNLLLDFTWEMKADSDHWSFYERGIPTMMLHTGLHGDYHRPSDDVEKLNPAGMERITRVLFRLALEAANADAVPAFRKYARAEYGSRLGQLEASLPSLPPRLGLLWNEPSKPGDAMLATQVVYGSPAYRAGLKVGDRLRKVDGEPITDGVMLRSAVLLAKSQLVLSIERKGAKEPTDVTVKLDGNPVRVGLSWRQDDAEPTTAIVTRVVAGSPAALAGVRLRDRIYQFNGEDFRNNDELLAKLQTMVGPVELKLESNGRIRNVKFVLPPLEKPKAPTIDHAPPEPTEEAS